MEHIGCVYGTAGKSEARKETFKKSHWKHNFHFDFKYIAIKLSERNSFEKMLLIILLSLLQ